ncbi:MAG: MFS transporter [Armatimonadetes bacterium]|nr:MFS transporter [Armatimonadota bacterium]
MTRNVKIVLTVSVLFGAATGVYEFILPYYLDEQGLSYQSMGTVFAVAAAGMLLLRILMGQLADVWGRKPFYGLALGGSAIAMWLTPTTGVVAWQAALKTIREAMFVTRETLHPVILYEESRGRFMDFMGKTRGMEFLFQAAGTLLAGTLFVTIGTGGNLRLGAVMLAVGFVLFWLVFRERPQPEHGARRAGGMRDLFSWDMHRNLKVITISFFVFNIGMWCSHSFIMPLFFSKKFGVTPGTVAWVMVLHRVTIALPLLLAGTLKITRLKQAYIWALVAEGAVLSASALVPNFYGASAVWLLHDLIGAGIWIPVQGLIIQDYTRPDRRALEMGKLQGYGGVGTIIGPWLAGLLSEQVSVSAPFFVSGLLMIAAAVVLVALRLDGRGNATAGAEVSDEIDGEGSSHA